MISLFSGLREQRLVELLVGLSLHLVLVFDLGHILLPPVGNLQKEHAVVVDHVEEDYDVDNQGEQVLHGGSWVAFVDLLCINLSADENELNDYDGDEVDDPSGVVVEQKQFGLIVGLSFCHKSLVL